MIQASDFSNLKPPLSSVACMDLRIFPWPYQICDPSATPGFGKNKTQTCASKGFYLGHGSDDLSHVFGVEIHFGSFGKIKKSRFCALASWIY
jgi:hypothetical protein